MTPLVLGEIHLPVVGPGDLHGNAMLFVMMRGLGSHISY